MARRERLDRDVVVRAAVTLADDGGLAAVTMRAVATVLGVEAMSLYHHVRGKDDLLDGMVDAVFEEFHSPVPGADWADQMRRRARTGRAALLRHRWAVGLMDSRRGAGPATLRHHDAVLGCLREAGFTVRLAGHAFAVLDAYLYGFCLQEVSLPFTPGEDLADLGAQMLDALPDGELPWFREFALERALQPGYEFGEEFEVGLDLVLGGLARRLAGATTQPGSP